MIIAIISWLVLAVAVGYVADQRGRSAVGWVVLSLLVSPIIAGVMLLLVPRNLAVLEERQLADGGNQCPMCVDVIRGVTTRCTLCGSEYGALVKVFKSPATTEPWRHSPGQV